MAVSPSAWLPDGRFLLLTLSGQLSVMPPLGGEKELLVESLSGPRNIQHAYLLGNGRAVLYSGMDAPGGSQIRVGSGPVGNGWDATDSGWLILDPGPPSWTG